MKKPAWRNSGQIQEGVLVAANEAQAWLLEWWWKHYSLYNQFPVLFIDLGLSDRTRRWCQERGNCFALPEYGLKLADKNQIDPIILTEWEFFYGKTDWCRRLAFFQKPLCCLQSPFQKTLWLDLDCEVRCPLSEIFAYLDDPGVCISKDLTLTSTQNKTIYNSGVIGFTHGHPLILEWAGRVFDQNGSFHSDQELLTALIAVKGEPISILSSIFQWSHYFGDNALARIVHWHGPKGKIEIQKQIGSRI